MERYYEQMVQKIPKSKDWVILFFVWLGVAAVSALTLAVVGSYLDTYEIALLMVVMFIMFGALYTKNMRMEFEFIFIDNEIRVDKIQSRGNRKSLTVVDVSHMTAFGRYTPQKKRNYTPYKTFTCRTGRTPEVWYAVYMEDGRLNMLIFEPDSTMLELIRATLPRQLAKAAFEDAPNRE